MRICVKERERGDVFLPRSSLHGLPVEDLDRPAGPGVDLVVHHVLEALVVRGPDEDLGGELAAREAVIQNLHMARRKMLGNHT